jgi:hypothetical protein
MRVEQKAGKIVFTTPERDEFGETYLCERVINLSTAQRLRDEFDAAIKICESMQGFREQLNDFAEETMERDLRAEGWGPEAAEGSKPELSELLAAYRKLSADMAVLFARKKIQDARVGGQAVGMETYRLIFTGSELGNIWRQMAQVEKLVKQTWYP